MHYLVAFLNFIYTTAFNLVGSYGLAIVLLSVVVNIILFPFYRLTYKLEQREQDIQNILRPKIQKINQIKSGKAKHEQLQLLYKYFSYSPLFALRSLSSLLIQIPFFIAAYQMLSHYSALQGVGFGFIPDLGKPDALLLGLNLLPIIMTLINMVTIFMVPYFGEKERLQSFCLAIFFLVLLYMSPAALVLYWTCNNIINLIRVFVPWVKQNKVKDISQAILCRLKCLLDQGYFTIFATLIAFYMASTLQFFPYLLGSSKSQNLIIYFLCPLFALAILLRLYNFIRAKVKHANIKLVIILVLLACSWMFGWAFGRPLYLCGVLIIIGLFDINKIKFNRQYFILVLCIMLLPALLILEGNITYFYFWVSLLYFGILFFVAIAVYVVLCLISKPLNLKQITWITISFIAAFMLLYIVQDVVNYTVQPHVLFIFVFVVLLCILWLFMKKVKVLLFFLICMILFSAFFVGQQIHRVVFMEKDYGKINTVVIPEELKALKMKDTPSIFLIVYDGFPRKETHEDLGLDYSLIEDIFNKNGFTIYDETYSLGGHSLNSMSSTFNMQDMNDMGMFWEQTLAGNSLSNYLLQANGYYTMIISPDSYLYGDYNFVDEMTLSRGSVSRQLEPMKHVFRGLVRGMMNNIFMKRFQQTDMTVEMAIELERLSKTKQSKTMVAVHYMFPGHGGMLMNQPINDAYRRNWYADFDGGYEHIDKELNTLVNNLPDAIIIVMSDHGPFMMADGLYQHLTLKDEEFTKNLMIDLMGTTMAIRWPDPDRAAKYDDDFILNQDLFPIVFAYLFDSEIPLKYKIKNREVRLRDHMFKENEFYPFYYRSNPQ